MYVYHVDNARVKALNFQHFPKTFDAYKVCTQFMNENDYSCSRVPPNHSPDES